MKKKPSYISLTQYFKGEASVEVVDEVKSWKELNEAEFIELYSIWEKYGSLALSYQPDLNAAWAKIDERTEKSSGISLNWILRIAAVVVFTVGIGWIVKNNWISSSSTREMFQATGENLIINLSDETVVTLSPGSKLYLTERFGDQSREVELVGKGFFEVEKNKLLPFQVKVDKVLVTVLGTSFQIDQNTDLVEVIVTEGIVTVKAASDSLRLSKDEKASFNTLDSMLTKSIELDENYSSWKSGTLKFSNSTILEFATVLEDFYDVEIEISEELENRMITADFDKQSLLEVFQIAKVTLNIQVDTLGISHFAIK